MTSSITDYRRIFFGNTDEELATLNQAKTNGVTLATLVKGLFTASSSTTVGLIVKGANSQTADLQQWQRSDGVAFTQIGATGKFSTVGQAFISNGVTGTGPVLHIENASGASNVGLIVKGVTSQSADLQQWQNSAGTVLAKVESSGNLLVNERVSSGGASLVLGAPATAGIYMGEDTDSGAIFLRRKMTVSDGMHITLGSANGTKIGTATTEKLAFYNNTPIVKPTGVAVTAAGIHAALVSLGLIAA